MSTIEVEITAPKNLKAGEVFMAEVEVPKPERKPRGQLAGIAVEDMTDEQLKREIINASSVLYKAQQRGASEETIAKNQSRVDIAKAEKAKRTPVAETPAETPALEETMDAETVYNEEI